MMATKKRKVPVKDFPIYTYTCHSHTERMALALIGDLPIIFKRKTPFAAKMAAEKWIAENCKDPGQ